MITRPPQRIALHVEEPAGVSRTAWPVTQGVPFADGELRRGRPVRIVSPEGHVLPAQGI